MNTPMLHSFTKHTLRLAATYLAIIMVMSLGFSGVFYATSSNQLGRQLPPNNSGPHRHSDDASLEINEEVHAYLQNRIEEGRHELLIRLVGLNVVALALGGGISLVLARRTLQPIEDAMKAQSQFVSDASHELRTPLTALRTMNEVALRRSTITDADARDIIGRNIEESVRLKDLSDAMLGLLKEDTKLEDTVQLNDVLESAAQQVRPAARALNISITIPVTNLQVRGNKQGLTQVLTILLDNAIKYSDKKGTVTIELEAKPKRVYVHVRDKGIGISPEDLPHVFERFYRSNKARSREGQGGFGIGLAIAQKIVRSHGGAISVDSVPGKGATFTVSFPAL